MSYDRAAEVLSRMFRAVQLADPEAIQQCGNNLAALVVEMDEPDFQELHGLACRLDGFLP